LLTYQEHKLKAELQLLREQPPESLVRTSIMPVVVAILLDELKRVNSQLEESLVAIQQKTRDSEAKRERLSHYLDDFQKIHAHLMARHSEAEQSAMNTLSRDQQAIAKKRRKAKEYYTSLSEEMETFISQHFGSPGEEETELETEKSRRKKTSLKQSRLDSWRKDDVQFKSLIDIIDELTDMWLESPHRPYKEIPDDYWPSHVRLLLTAGIAQVHPSNAGLIKLVPCFK
jgi:uncharacterized protein YfaS (alpha-2-macroglobulin family)